MKHNMGRVDRLVRAFVAAPLLIVFGFVFGTGSVLGVVAFVLAGIMVATAAVGYCPGYVPFGISTRGAVARHPVPATAGGRGWSASARERREPAVPRG